MISAPAGPSETSLVRRPEVARGPRVVAAVVALAALVGVWLVWRYFVETYAGQRLDQMAFDGATYGQGRLWSYAEPVLDVVSVSFVVVGIAAAMGIALLRRRWGLALQVAFLVAGANVTTQVLKHTVLHRDNLVGGYSYENTLPSGHTTVAASVAVALLVVVPRGVRPLVATLGAAYAALTGVSTLVGQWHRPSDAVAAVLVVVAWGGIVLACTPRSGLDPVPPHQGRVGPVSWATAGLLTIAGVVALAAARWSAVQVLGSSDAARPTVTAYVGGAFGVVGATALAFAVLLVLRQATACPRVG